MNSTYNISSEHDDFDEFDEFIAGGKLMIRDVKEMLAIKTLGYVNQLGRGIETVQKELMANKTSCKVQRSKPIS